MILLEFLPVSSKSLSRGTDFAVRRFSADFNEHPFILYIVSSILRDVEGCSLTQYKTPSLSDKCHYEDKNSMWYRLTNSETSSGDPVKL